MAKKQRLTKAKTHPELSNFDISVTSFGEIEGSMNIDELNEFLNKNVEDKKLKKDQLPSKKD